MTQGRSVVRRTIDAFALAMLAVAASSGVAWAAPDRAGTATPGTAYAWDGAVASAANTGYDAASGEPCGKTFDTYCDTTLVHIDVPADYWERHTGLVRISIDGYRPIAASDFDLYVYKSDKDGNRGANVPWTYDYRPTGLLGVRSSGLPYGAPENVTLADASGWYLVQVVYWDVIESQYSGRVEFDISSASRPSLPAPRDVDEPAGIQDSLASDPSLGYRSRSEMHIAQSPADPDLLVAASKAYNRDPDSLAEYEFKIATYVSFDRGKTWRDLGQVNVCPAVQAPPDSWPDNTCYPEDDPKADGTGSEDGAATTKGVAVRPRTAARQLDRTVQRGTTIDTVRRDETRGADYGEEYIVSDPWVQFDDEGNAYLMVLDAPPYGGQYGWGMSTHVWESVSKRDLETGQTWSNRSPINSYPDDDVTATLELLDDKNTFAMNNAGADGDGQIGTLIACWGQTVGVAVKQQIVCERSTDGGRSWPDQPVQISGLQQLVIGVHVIADPSDEGRFYAVWNHYTGNVAQDGRNELWMAQTLDGGRTWLPPTLVAPISGIPRQLPGERFRNLSIPMMAADPDSGALYIAVSTYEPERAGVSDHDGGNDDEQADVMLFKSTTGGATWSRPMRVNQDATNADQLQPQIDVTESGQVNVSYFDRRHDLDSGDPEGHPGNRFFDLYLSRSNDGGATFTDVRVSHDPWDPRINPPISTSGEFVGDYQGLVANDCDAVAFVNDTHLANAASRDPDFDRGLPRSPYQEALAWRIPNSRELGGPRKAKCGKGRAKPPWANGPPAHAGR